MADETHFTFSDSAPGPDPPLPPGMDIIKESYETKKKISFKNHDMHQGSVGGYITVDGKIMVKLNGMIFRFDDMYYIRSIPPKEGMTEAMDIIKDSDDNGTRIEFEYTDIYKGIVADFSEPDNNGEPMEERGWTVTLDRNPIVFNFDNMSDIKFIETPEPPLPHNPPPNGGKRKSRHNRKINKTKKSYKKSTKSKKNKKSTRKRKTNKKRKSRRTYRRK